MGFTRAAPVAILLALAAHGALAQDDQAAWGLASLMGQMAKVTSASGHFTERKTLHVLDAPLISTGTLTYLAPAYLRKQTSAPSQEIFVLDHDDATITDGADGQVRKFSLAAAPQIGGLVAGIRATLAGDLPTLARFYNVQLSGNDAAWQLVLRPKDAGLRHFVNWILIRGSRDRINTIDTASGNGDHSEMGVIEDTRDAK